MTRTSRLLFTEVPILGAILLAAVAFAVGYFLRYVVIEPDIRGIVCNETSDPPSWCEPRQLLIVVVQTLPGRWLTVALAVAAWVGSGRWVRWFSLVAVLAGVLLTVLHMALGPDPAPLAVPVAPSAAEMLYGMGPLVIALASPVALASWLGGGQWGRWLGFAAMVMGGMGTILYNAGPGVISLALGALRLISHERLPGGSR